MRARLGLDLGGTKIQGVLVDEGGRILAQARCETRRTEGAEAVFERCVELARELVHRLARELDPAASIATAGVGFAGLVDPARGVVIDSVILPGFEDFPLARRFAERLGVPCAVDNDATCAGLGEYAALGSPPGLNLVVLTIGTGIGAALFVAGELYRGALGTAGELGHTTIDWNGEPCWCANKGCLNTLASGTAIARRAAGVAFADGKAPLPDDPEIPSLADVARRAAAGDRTAQRAIDDGARALGVGLASVINALNPDRIALCGGVTELGPAWLAAVVAEAERRAFPAPFRHVTIELTRSGAHTGAIGAARLHTFR